MRAFDLYVIIHGYEKKYMISGYVLISISASTVPRLTKGDLLVLLIENIQPRGWFAVDLKFRVGYKFRAEDDESAVAHFDSFDIDPSSYLCIIDITADQTFR